MELTLFALLDETTTHVGSFKGSRNNGRTVNSVHAGFMRSVRSA